VDDVILAWAEILPDLPVATRSAVKEAQPLTLDDENDIVTFGIPPNIVEAAKPRFKREAETIRKALSERLGRKLRFNVVPHDMSGTAERAAGVSPPAANAPAEEEPEFVDPSELLDAPPDDAAVASFGLLTESLGASVVEERPRE
jgi:hypothetical protein